MTRVPLVFGTNWRSNLNFLNSLKKKSKQNLMNLNDLNGLKKNQSKT